MSKPETIQPIRVTERMLVYLDDLRESGKTNMFGAIPYIREEFGLDQEDSKRVLGFWMKTFKDRQEAIATAWDELEERCPDCGGMESFCEEAGCQSSGWTDADTKKYKEGVKNARVKLTRDND